MGNGTYQKPNLKIGTPWVLEMYILAAVLHGDSYGYAIAKSNCIGMGESTVYPILRRLEKAAYIESYSQIYDSKLRRLFKITDAGQELLAIYIEQWRKMKASIDSVL